MKMKFNFLLSWLLLAISLFSITFIDGERTMELNLEELQSYAQIQVETSREKEDNLKKETWLGVDLPNLLQKFQIEDFDQLLFTSEDNYQVRLSKQEIEEYKSIIALKKNEEQLTQEKMRLVVPQVRDMFWIQGISTITTEKKTEMPLPYTLFTAKKILEEIQIISDPAPFKNVSGFYFIDLVAGVYPFLQGDFLLLSADGVSQLLDYKKYLKNAVIICHEDSYELRSPDMPGGMWIKNLAYIQSIDRGVFFKDQLSDFDDLAELLNWKDLPDFLLDQSGNRIDPGTKFSDPVWQNVKKVTWQE